MKIRFLGTGAADWNIEERKDGEFFRRFSSLLVNEDLLIDPGPHIFDFCEMEGCSALLDSVKNVLVTHSHKDHFNLDSLAELVRHKNVHVFCNETVSHKVCSITDNYTVMKVGDELQVGGYKVKAYFANHSVIATGEIALMYGVCDDEKNLFYGCDTSWLPYETWRAMWETSFDCVVLDVTLGDVVGPSNLFEHNNIEMVRMMLEAMRNKNVLKNNGKAVGTHFSKNLHLDHEKISERLSSFDMVTAYDGLEIDI